MILVIHYCSDKLRSQLLAILRELVAFSMCIIVFFSMCTRHIPFFYPVTMKWALGLNILLAPPPEAANNNNIQHSSGCFVSTTTTTTTATTTTTTTGTAAAVTATAATATATTCISMHNCQELYIITRTQRQSIWYVEGTNYRQGYNCFGYMWTAPKNGTCTNLLWTKHRECSAQESVGSSI